MGVKIQRAPLGWSQAPFGKIKSMICPRQLKKRMHHAMQLYKSACTICFQLKGVVSPTVLFFKS